jgi:uncharacterized protein
MIALRLVLDTNVFVSAALKDEGIPRTVLSLAIQKPARLYVSPGILAEFREVLSRPELRIRRGLQRRFMDLINERSFLVHPLRQIHVTPDPDDNMFLECAEAARADYLITGNTRHFPEFWKQTKVITPHQFLSLAAPHLLG